MNLDSSILVEESAREEGEKGFVTDVTWTDPFVPSPRKLDEHSSSPARLPSDLSRELVRWKGGMTPYDV